MNYMLAMRIYILFGFFIVLCYSLAIMFNKIPDKTLLATKTKVIVILGTLTYIAIGIIIFKFGPFPSLQEVFTKPVIQ